MCESSRLFGKMESKLGAFILLLRCIAAVSSMGIPSQVKPNEIGASREHASNLLPPTMEFLGTADGISYYADIYLMGTWLESKEYCETHNFSQASIKTKNQADLLDLSLRKYYPMITAYWTSLHESRRPSMMEWDGTDGEQPDTAFLDNWYWREREYQYCAVLQLLQFQPPNNRMTERACQKIAYTVCQAML